jgi:hypothetical protein
MLMQSMEKKWRLEGLGARGPYPGLEDKLSLFGQFVGDWEIREDRLFEEGGTETVLDGELHWEWILEGKAVQDVWMFRDKETNRIIPAGTTVRMYDPKIDAWQSIWFTTERHEVLSFIGRKVGEEIVLEGRNHENDLLRWIFSDISPNSFTWREEKSKDLGKTWATREKMKIRRKGTP